MPTYLVDYDLNAPGKDYTKLIEKIVSLGQGHYHVLKSSWFVYHNTFSASQLFDYLKPAIDNNDSMFITKITENNSGWLEKSAWDWLNDALENP